MGMTVYRLAPTVMLLALFTISSVLVVFGIFNKPPVVKQEGLSLHSLQIATTNMMSRYQTDQYLRILRAFRTRYLVEPLG